MEEEEVGTEPRSSTAQPLSFQVYISLREGLFLLPAHPGASPPLQMLTLFSLEQISHFLFFTYQNATPFSKPILNVVFHIAFPDVPATGGFCFL